LTLKIEQKDLTVDIGEEEILLGKVADLDIWTEGLDIINEN
jgi:hypothetical protein